MSEGQQNKKSYPLVARLEELTTRIGTGYPHPFDAPCSLRSKTPLGKAVGISQFGANMLILPPGSWSAQRHWHQNEDELVYVLEGEVTLVTDEGERLLQAGSVVGFPAGQENGHHLVNKGKREAKLIEIGTRAHNETAHYPDIDLMAHCKDGKASFTTKKGEPCK